eukprot:gene48322-64835_t
MQDESPGDETKENEVNFSSLFSEDDLSIACNVLDKLGQNLDVYNSRALRPLRVLMQPFFDGQKRMMFGGHDPADHSYKKLRRMRMGIEKHNQRAQDQLFIKQTKLRAGRFKKLELLSEQEGLEGLGNVPMILDGAVEDYNNENN